MRFRIDVAIDTATQPPTATLALLCTDAAFAPVLNRVVTLADDGRGATMPLPTEPPPGADAELQALCTGGSTQFHRALGHFRARRTDDSEMFGRYLFAVLVGKNWWDAIKTTARPAGDRLVELAVAWPPGPASYPFDRLPWELLHDGTRPLVAANDPRVAITRIVPRPAGEVVPPGPRPLDLPPRVLFVIGAAPDDPSVRAATEILGLLRSLENPQRTIHARMLERATPKRVRDAVSYFRPEVVHFICHGDVKDGKSWLLLQRDEPGDAAECDSEKLLSMLRPGGLPAPTIVVLSACRSAESSDRPEGAQAITSSQLAQLPNQPLAMGSLGAQLVHGGVPIVIGMSGRVSDVAARLFTRRFEACLLEGQPLVSATADARRAPFVEARVKQASIDWAYPTLLMDESVDPDYAPTPARETKDGISTQDAWVTSFRITDSKQPVFCARQDFLDAFDALFRRQGHGMLIAYAQPEPDDEGSARYGKTRLLEQLTFRTLRDGNLPLVLSSPRRGSTPGALPKLVDALRKQQMFVVDQLGLPQPEHRLVAELKKVIDSPASIPAAIAAVEAARTSALAAQQAALPEARDRYRQRVASIDNLKAELKDSGAVTGRALCFALKYDLWALAGAFRSVLVNLRQERVDAGRPVAPWLDDPERSRAVLLLDDLNLYDESFIAALFELANQGGSGSADDPSPLAVTFSFNDGPAAQTLRPLVETPKPHAYVLRLQAFPKGEDMLVYQRVLLHPFNSTLFDYDGVCSGKPFAVDGSADADVTRSCEDYFRLMVKGRPVNLTKEALYAAAQNAKTKQYLVDADDSDVIKVLGLQL